MQNDQRSIENILASLSSDTDTEKRITIWRDLFEYWYGLIEPSHGLSEERLRGWPLPMPLYWMYRTAGLRPTDLASQNCLLRPDQVEWNSASMLDDGKLVFYVENQGDYLWATEPGGYDPPVWGKFNDDGAPWTEEGVTLSEFLIALCLFESTMTANCGASAAVLPRSVLDEVVEKVPQLPLKPWRWPADQSCFYAREGVTAFAAPNEDAETYSVFIGAKSPWQISFLESIIANDKFDTWEHVAMD